MIRARLDLDLFDVDFTQVHLAEPVFKGFVDRYYVRGFEPQQTGAVRVNGHAVGAGDNF